jgi:cation:H+ antiporter
VDGVLPFERLELAVNVLVFASAALVVWLAGTRLSLYGDEIANRTGIGRALIGALLLGGITSLPEAVTTAAASMIGNAPLAVNNIFGGVAMQVAILGLADLIVPGRALSSRVRQPAVLLQGVLLIAVLVLAAAGIAMRDVLILGVGIWAAAVLGAALMAFVLIHRFGNDTAWQPASPAASDVRDGESGTRRKRNRAQAYSAARLGVSTAAMAGVILAAGFVLARSGDVLSEQSGLGANFMGILFLAGCYCAANVSCSVRAWIRCWCWLSTPAAWRSCT